MADHRHSQAPNVLWIYCDELRADALGCFAQFTDNWHDNSLTPRLDALADGGVRFERAYCTSPICVASRTSLLTARLPEATGVYANEGAWPGFPLPARLPTWVEAFAQAGYATASFGKTHLPADYVDAFAHHDPVGGGMGDAAAGLADDDASILRPANVSTTIGGRLPRDEPYPPTAVTANAIDWIHASARDGSKPWLMRASYLQPHTPVFAPPRLLERAAKAVTDDGDWLRPHASRFERRFAEVIHGGDASAGNPLGAEQRLFARRCYAALVMWVDEQVGKLLDALAQSGERERTIVVFESDHGAALGEGGRYAKHVFSPEVHRVPRIVAWPGSLAASVNRRLTGSVDLGPTLAAMAGVSLTFEHDGVDAIGGRPRDALISTVGHGETTSLAFPNLGKGRWRDDPPVGWPRRSCIRTADWRLDMNIRADGRDAADTERDLYLARTVDDPLEAVNHANDPQTARTRDDLAQRLLDHAKTAIEPEGLPTE